MVKRRNLRPDPRRAMADLLARQAAQTKALGTVPAGVKDLGEAGDVVWPRPDGTPVSVRDVDLELADARQRIEDAETSLSETGTRLTDAERAVSDAVASIDGKLDESALDDPETSERLATSMTDVARHLIVTDSAILNHATLIGQTVVDDINVQGKLIGKDGVFTGTVDFENINVSDQVLAERLTGEHIYGTVIEGGEIRTTDGLPGQVILSDEGYVDSSNGAKYPGIRIVPVNSSELVSPPGIGPNSNGFVITSGRNTTGGRGLSIYSPRSAAMSFVEGSTRSDVVAGKEYGRVVAYDGNGNKGEVAATPRFGQVQATAADGSQGLIQATSSDAMVSTKDPSGSYMSIIRSNGRSAFLRSNGSDGLGRVLSVDSDGVWVKVQRGDGSGNWDFYNLNPQRKSNPFPMPSGWVVDGSNNAQYTVTLGACYWDGVLKSTGTLPAGWSTIGYAPKEAWPRNGDQLRTLPTASGRTVLGKISASDGKIEIRVDQSSSGIFMHFSPFSYLV